MDLQLQRLDGGIDRVRLVGRMDSTGVAAIDDRLSTIAATDSARVLIDLSGVSFLASIGIRCLLTNARTLRQRGGRMALLSPQTVVEDVLRLTGIETMMPIFHDLEAASAALRAPTTSA